MEYVSLEDRIMVECKDKNKEYLLKKSINALLGLFYAIHNICSTEMKEYLLTEKKNDVLDPLLYVLPLVLKSGKSFDTEKVISSIQNIFPNITLTKLFDCLVLFSYTFDLLYGTSFKDTLDNLNSLSNECINKLKVKSLPKLAENTISSVSSDYVSLKALKDYVSILNLENSFDYKYYSTTSKAIALFIKGMVKEKSSNAYKEVEKEFGDVIQIFLSSI